MRILLHAPWPYEYSTELGSALANLPSRTDVRLVVCRDYPYARQCECRVAAVYPDPRRQAWKLIRALWHLAALCRMARLLWRWRPHIFHVQALRHPDVDWLLLVWARLLRVPIVWTAHNSLPHEQRAHHRLFYRLVYRFAEAVIVHTHHSAGILRDRLGVRPDKMQVIAHGNLLRMTLAAPARAQARRELDLPPEKQAFVLLFFGRIRHYKGLDVLLDAIERLADPRLILIVAGVDHAGLAAGLEPSANLRLDLRRIDDASVARYFRAADLAVLPYRQIDQSGVLMLAMSYDCPVLATEVGGLGEVIENGRTGFLLPPGDSLRLAEKIAWIRAHPQRLADVRAQANRAIRQAYDWRQIAARTHGLYKAARDGRYKL